MPRKMLTVAVSVLSLLSSRAVPAHEWGPEEHEWGSEETVALSDVGQGSLLAATAKPGRYAIVPLQRTDVRISVRGMVVEAHVEQLFTNPGDEWLEAVYVFPLPQGAAVHDMRLVVGERVIVGQIRERGEARRVYERAKAAGSKASLTEQERPNIFTTSVANIGPGESVTVTIAYQEVLEYDSGRFELRFPMVVGPRYTPGVPLPTAPSGTGWAFDSDQVPDASRVTPFVRHPARGPVNPVRLAVTLDAGLPLERLASPSHPVEISAQESGVRNIVLEGSFADRDFVLEWFPARGSEPTAAVFSEELNGEFYVLAMILPPADEFTESVRLPRETVFVIDTSGSMGGASIDQARRALLLALERLQPEDFFNIIEFDSSFARLFPASKPAMPAAVAEAASWVQDLQADGGTEMMAPLMAALDDPAELTPLRQIIFITDGCVGNERALFAAVDRELGRSRLFTVGIGSAPNSHFMERAAAFGRGSFTHIGTAAEVAARMDELFAKIENPVLADIELVWPDPDAESWPERCPDLYDGEPVVVTARLGTIHGDLAASGVRAHQSWQTRLPLRVRSDLNGIHRLWARRKIASLMDQHTRGVSEDEVRDQVVEVALDHHLVSRYTSLVAVDVTPTRPDGEQLQTGGVETNLPAGWHYDKVFGALPQGATAARLRLLTAILALLCALALRARQGCAA